MTSLCSLDDCNTEIEAKGYCKKHYGRLNRYGDPEVTKHDKDHDDRDNCKCPKCDKELKSKSGMRIHYTKIHNEQLNLNKYNCDYCGDTMEVTDYRIKNNDNVFCSSNCSAKYQSENYSGENSHSWKGGKVELNCEQCEEPFKVSRYFEDSAKYCSRECVNEAFSERYDGENHPQYKGGKIDYKGFKKVRKDVLESRNSKCKRCGMTAEEHKNKYNRNLDVHHINPVRNYDQQEKAHKRTNLVILCRSCHAKVEKLSIEEQEKELGLISWRNSLNNASRY